MCLPAMAGVQVKLELRVNIAWRFDTAGLHVCCDKSYNFLAGFGFLFKSS